MEPFREVSRQPEYTIQPEICSSRFPSEHRNRNATAHQFALLGKLIPDGCRPGGFC
jgi:hypothetical protein